MRLCAIVVRVSGQRDPLRSLQVELLIAACVLLHSARR